jgi:hypothetical protein
VDARSHRRDGQFPARLPLCAVSLSLCDANAVVAASTLADALISIDQYAFGKDAERKNRLRLRLTERLAVTPTLETELMAAVQAALTE